MEQPSSLGLKPVKLRDCMEELVKFTLQYHASRTLTLDFDLGLSADYCSALLREDPHGSSASVSSSSPAGGFEGVPPYPLYKRLAMALAESILCGTIYRSNKKLTLFDEEDGASEYRELDKLFLEKGTELLNILESIDFEIHVQEPFFTQLKDGNKTVGGRCATGNYNCIASGALILANKCLVLEVKDLHRYSSFREMLEAEVPAKYFQESIPSMKVYKYTETSTQKRRKCLME